MDKEKFAKEVLKVGVRQFHHVLAGRRGLSFMKAKKAAFILGGEIDLWIGFDKGKSEHLMVNRRDRWQRWERAQK
jgi:hypothetical protein